MTAAFFDAKLFQRNDGTANRPLIELADMVVRGKIKLSRPQMRMLIEMLPFAAPKLSAVGYMREADTFATRLDRAIESPTTFR